MEISKSKRTWIIIGAVLMTATVQLSSAGLNNTMYAILSGMNGLQYYALLANTLIPWHGDYVRHRRSYR